MVVGMISNSEGFVTFKRYQKNEDPSDRERKVLFTFGGRFDNTAPEPSYVSEEAWRH
jgi:hypothetical protein